MKREPKYKSSGYTRRAVAKRIVGWAVHTGNDLSACAMYPLEEREAAFDAAKRWGANITALCLHPDAPTIKVSK